MAWLEDSIEEFKKLKTPAKVAVIGGVVAAGLIGFSYVRTHQKGGQQSSGGATVSDPFGALTNGTGPFGVTANGTGSSTASSDLPYINQLIGMIHNLQIQVQSVGQTAGKNNQDLINIYNKVYGKTTKPPPVHKLNGTPAHPIEKVLQ